MDMRAGAAAGDTASASDIGLPDYQAFLEAKIAAAPAAGLPCELDEVRATLTDGRPMKDHVRHIVRWAVEGGRRGLFESFGLHKTMQQLEIGRLVTKKADSLGLIVVPLNVRREFIRDASLLNIPVDFCQSESDIDAALKFHRTPLGRPIILTNYESVREGKIDISRFGFASLDEADVLRSYGSKTFQEFLPLFADVPYRYVATATPAPNRFKELIHYAGFLGIMDTGQALTRFFQRNSEKAGDLTLYEHKREEFFAWLNSWAVFITSPSNLCRCPCHVEQTSSAAASAASSSDNGIAISAATELGSVIAIAAEPTQPLQAISPPGEFSVADACVQSTEGKASDPIPSGSQCADAAATRQIKTGPHTGAEAFRSAKVGSDTKISSPTWANPAQDLPSNGSITSEDMSRETASGQAENSKQETPGGPCSSASTAAPSQSQHGPKSSGFQPTCCTKDTSAAGQRSEYSASSCASCRCTEGYDLPPINIRWHCVETDIANAGEEKDGQRRLLRTAAIGVVDAAREKRRTLEMRIAKVCEIVNDDPNDHFIIWHDLEDERRAIEAALPACEAVYGTQKLHDREDIVSRFADGELSIIAAKPIMLGGGVNLQRHCHRAIFAGVGFKFRDFIQAIHRIQRFGQSQPVTIDIIYSETETEVVRALQMKWSQHDDLASSMADLVQRTGLNHEIAINALARSIGVERRVVEGDGWRLAHNDCVDEARRLDEGSLDLVVTSIPFSNHYEYTPSYNDFGHTDDDAHFFAQLDYLTPELLRALAPGRLACIHVKDRIMFGSVTGQGVPTVNPFHAKCIDHYIRHGFQYLGMITVITDVVRENNQTYRLSYTEMLKDGTKMGVGSPEYVLLMRKPQTDRTRGYADTPVVKDAGDYSLARWQIDAGSFWRSSGDRPLMIEELWEVEERFAHMATGKITKRFREETRDLIYSFRAHVDIGDAIEARPANDDRGHLPRTFSAITPGSHHPDVWDDVVRMRTLNAEQVAKGREKHVCPLQFDIVDRLIERYSMPGELVYDPFCGLGTVPLRAILSGRRGAGSELNPDYFAHSISYLSEAVEQQATPSLFDLLDLEMEAAA